MRWDEREREDLRKPLTDSFTHGSLKWQNKSTETRLRITFQRAKSGQTHTHRQIELQLSETAERQTDLQLIHRKTRVGVIVMLVVLLILHAVSCAHSHGPPGAAVPVKQCPSACQCEEDGILLLVDCSEQGLSSVPTDLSPLTSYLWVRPPSSITCFAETARGCG